MNDEKGTPYITNITVCMINGEKREHERGELKDELSYKIESDNSVSIFYKEPISDEVLIAYYKEYACFTIDYGMDFKGASRII